jgi:signal transduction histidine kinase
LKLTIKTRLIISYSALAAFLAVSLLAVSNHYLAKQFQIYVSHRQEMKNAEIAEAVSRSFRGTAEAPDAGFLSFISGYAASLLEQGIAVMVYDAGGGLMYCTDAGSGEACAHMRTESEEEWHVACPDFEGAYSRVSFPIERNGRALGSVMLGYHSPFYFGGDESSFLGAFNRVFFVMAVLFFAASVGIGVVMAGMISGPIARVAGRTRRIADGDYSDEPVETGAAEIDELSRSVDYLAESLRTQYKLKARMASAYAHEFRTPLAVLQSGLEAMEDGLWRPTKERIASLRDEVVRMSRMASEVDNLVRVGKTEPETEKKISDVSAMTSRILDGYGASIAAKNLTLEFDGEELRVPVDPDKFSQIVSNLVSNAVKYTREGGRVKVRVYEEGGNAVLSVEDDGIGIPEADMPFIFEHMYRTEASREYDRQGTGIGLAVAKAAAEAHGGEIKAESAPGRGSKFTVSVPMEEGTFPA